MTEPNAPLIEMVLAAGALGTAAFGIVEGLKWTRLGELGFSKIEETLGSALMPALKVAYGPQYVSLLRAQYRQGRGKGELPRTLRQGIRIGMNMDNVGGISQKVGVGDEAQLKAVVEKLTKGTALSAEEKNLLGRFELAVDARIDAALALADNAYVGGVRMTAIFISIFLAIVTAIAIGEETKKSLPIHLVFIVGLVAVPLAPIAKDVGKAIQAAATAFRARK